MHDGLDIGAATIQREMHGRFARWLSVAKTHLTRQVDAQEILGPYQAFVASGRCDPHLIRPYPHTHIAFSPSDEATRIETLTDRNDVVTNRIAESHAISSP